MPLHTVIVREDALDHAEKAALARRITDIHVKQSGVPSNWVHVVFQAHPAGAVSLPATPLGCRFIKNLQGAASIGNSRRMADDKSRSA